MAGIGIQPQRVPFATIEVAGRKVPVFVSLEWYRVLQRLAGEVDVPSSSSGPGSSGGGSSTVVIQQEVGTTEDSAIDSIYGVEQTVKVLAMALERGLQALETDSELSRLRAQVASLAARIDGLEQSA